MLTLDLVHKTHLQCCVNVLLFVTGTLDSAHLKSVNGNCKKTKKKSNNYASVDCGAEVIEANAEAVVSHNVGSVSRGM